MILLLALSFQINLCFLIVYGEKHSAIIGQKRMKWQDAEVRVNNWNEEKIRE